MRSLALDFESWLHSCFWYAPVRYGAEFSASGTRYTSMHAENSRSIRIHHSYRLVHAVEAQKRWCNRRYQMAISEWLVVLSVLSTLLSPLIALRISQEVERRREERDRKEHIFKVLMATRAEQLSPRHVEALNMIDVEFDGPKHRVIEVAQAWGAYHDHLNQPATKMSIDVWVQKKDDLFIDLLFQMAVHLGYSFDRTRIKNSSYSPIAYGNAQKDQLAIREGLAALLRGERDLPVTLALKNPLPNFPAATALPVSTATPAIGSSGSTGREPAASAS